MGLNHCKVSNKSSNVFYIITFNDTDTQYLYYREMCQPPVNGEELSVDGQAGGRAVKVGVVFNSYQGRIFYDLFKVNHDATLEINKVSTGNGVESFTETKGVQRLDRGRSIKMSADDAEGLGQLFNTISQLFGLLSTVVRAAWVFKNS